MREYCDVTYYFDEEAADLLQMKHNDVEYMTAEHFYEVVHYA